MKIKETLKELRTYYQMSRQVGHTHVMLNGAVNSPKALVLVGNLQQGMDLQPKLHPIQVVTLGSISTLRGKSAPLAIDNAAMWLLLDRSVREIERLEAIVDLHKEVVPHDVVKQEYPTT